MHQGKVRERPDAGNGDEKTLWEASLSQVDLLRGEISALLPDDEARQKHLTQVLALKGRLDPHGTSALLPIPPPARHEPNNVRASERRSNADGDGRAAPSPAAALRSAGPADAKGESSTGVPGKRGGPDGGVGVEDNRKDMSEASRRLVLEMREQRLRNYEKELRRRNQHTAKLDAQRSTLDEAATSVHEHREWMLSDAEDWKERLSQVSLATQPGRQGGDADWEAAGGALSVTKDNAAGGGQPGGSEPGRSEGDQNAADPEAGMKRNSGAAGGAKGEAQPLPVSQAQRDAIILATVEPDWGPDNDVLSDDGWAAHEVLSDFEGEFGGGEAASPTGDGRGPGRWGMVQQGKGAAGGRGGRAAMLGKGSEVSALSKRLQQELPAIEARLKGLRNQFLERKPAPVAVSGKGAPRSARDPLKEIIPIGQGVGQAGMDAGAGFHTGAGMFVNNGPQQAAYLGTHRWPGGGGQVIPPPAHVYREDQREAVEVAREVVARIVAAANRRIDAIPDLDTAMREWNEWQKENSEDGRRRVAERLLASERESQCLELWAQLCDELVTETAEMELADMQEERTAGGDFARLVMSAAGMLAPQRLPSADTLEAGGVATKGMGYRDLFRVSPYALEHSTRRKALACVVDQLERDFRDPLPLDPLQGPAGMLQTGYVPDASYQMTPQQGPPAGTGGVPCLPGREHVTAARKEERFWQLVQVGFSTGGGEQLAGTAAVATAGYDAPVHPGAGVSGKGAKGAKNDMQPARKMVDGGWPVVAVSIAVDSGYVTCIAFSQGVQMLAAGTSTGELWAWDLSSWTFSSQSQVPASLPVLLCRVRPGGGMPRSAAPPAPGRGFKSKAISSKSKATPATVDPSAGPPAPAAVPADYDLMTGGRLPLGPGEPQRATVASPSREDLEHQRKLAKARQREQSSRVPSAILLDAGSLPLGIGSVRGGGALVGVACGLSGHQLATVDEGGVVKLWWRDPSAMMPPLAAGNPSLLSAKGKGRAKAGSTVPGEDLDPGATLWAVLPLGALRMTTQASQPRPPAILWSVDDDNNEGLDGTPSGANIVALHGSHQQHQTLKQKLLQSPAGNTDVRHAASAASASARGNRLDGKGNGPGPGTRPGLGPGLPGSAASLAALSQQAVTQPSRPLAVCFHPARAASGAQPMVTIPLADGAIVTVCVGAPHGQVDHRRQNQQPPHQQSPVDDSKVQQGATDSSLPAVVPSTESGGTGAVSQGELAPPVLSAGSTTEPPTASAGASPTAADSTPAAQQGFGPHANRTVPGSAGATPLASAGIRPNGGRDTACVCGSIMSPAMLDELMPRTTPALVVPLTFPSMESMPGVLGPGGPPGANDHPGPQQAAGGATSHTPAGVEAGVDIATSMAVPSKGNGGQGTGMEIGIVTGGGQSAASLAPGGVPPIGDATSAEAGEGTSVQVQQEVFVGHASPPVMVDYMPDTRIMVSADASGLILFWPASWDERSGWGWFRPTRLWRLPAYPTWQRHPSPPRETNQERPSTGSADGAQGTGVTAASGANASNASAPPAKGGLFSFFRSKKKAAADAGGVAAAGVGHQQGGVVPMDASSAPVDGAVGGVGKDDTLPGVDGEGDVLPHPDPSDMVPWLHFYLRSGQRIRVERPCTLRGQQAVAGDRMHVRILTSTPGTSAQAASLAQAEGAASAAQPALPQETGVAEAGGAWELLEAVRSHGRLLAAKLTASGSELVLMVHSAASTDQPSSSTFPPPPQEVQSKKGPPVSANVNVPPVQPVSAILTPQQPAPPPLGHVSLFVLNCHTLRLSGARLDISDVALQGVIAQGRRAPLVVTPSITPLGTDYVIVPIGPANVSGIPILSLSLSSFQP
eukprot:jgi/Mesvir1/17554/Mv08801-RA.3